MKKLNMNDRIKVKLTDLGKDIYYHQYDDLIKAMQARGVPPISPSFPKVDKNGYSEFQLWYFISLYGPYIGMGKSNVTEDLFFYIDEADLVDAEPPKECE